MKKKKKKKNPLVKKKKKKKKIKKKKNNSSSLKKKSQPVMYVCFVITQGHRSVGIERKEAMRQTPEQSQNRYGMLS